MTEKKIAMVIESNSIVFVENLRFLAGGKTK